MQNNEISKKPILTEVDEHTYAIYLNVPGENVVLLQGIFETYEGIGLVRTISIKDCLICILTSKDSSKDCLKLLESIQEKVSWQNADNVKNSELYLGFTKKGIKNDSVLS